MSTDAVVEELWPALLVLATLYADAALAGRPDLHDWRLPLKGDAALPKVAQATYVQNLSWFGFSGGSVSVPAAPARPEASLVW